MSLGEETWKWALVVVLLAVFIILAKQAYLSLNNPEDQFPPPTDYMQGDSWDLEHGASPGPGAGQPVNVPEGPPGAGSGMAEGGSGQPGQFPSPAPAMTPAPATPGSGSPLDHAPEIDWGAVKDPTKK